MNRPGRTLAKDARGAVYVEFIIAFIPFLVTFLCLWQVSILFYAKLMVDHAAFSAARAAAVIAAEDPNRVGDSSGTVNQITDTRKTLIGNAVYLSLAPLIIDGTIGGDLTPTFPPGGTPGGADQTANPIQYQPMGGTTTNMRVKVTATFICRIAFAALILCKNPLATQFGIHIVPSTLTIASEGVFPYQGASYNYKP